MFYFVTLVVAFAVAANAANVRMEPTVNTFASGMWLKEKTLKETDVIKAVFVLKHDASAIKAFDRKLIDISTPKSPNYGNWLSVRCLFNF